MNFAVSGNTGGFSRLIKIDSSEIDVLKAAIKSAFSLPNANIDLIWEKNGKSILLSSNEDLKILSELHNELLCIKFTCVVASILG